METPADSSVHPAVEAANLDSEENNFVLDVTDAGPVLDPVYTGVRGNLVEIETIHRNISEATRALAGAPNDPAAQRRFRAGAIAQFQNAERAIKAATETIATRRQAIQNDIDGQLGIPTARTSVTDSIRHGDVRAQLRSLPRDERLNAVDQAIRGGDVEVAAAVLSASPLASGLTATEMSLVRMSAESRFTPRAVRLRDSLTPLGEKIERAAKANEARFAPIVGAGDSGEARRERALRDLEGGAA